MVNRHHFQSDRVKNYNRSPRYDIPRNAESLMRLQYSYDPDLGGQQNAEALSRVNAELFPLAFRPSGCTNM